MAITQKTNAARKQIEETLERWRTAVMRGDAETVTAQCVPEYELTLGDAQTIRGHDELEEMYCSLFAKAAAELTYEILDLRVDGSLATIYLRERLTVKPHGMEPERYTLKRLAVLTFEDGVWKFVRSMVNLQALPVTM